MTDIEELKLHLDYDPLTGVFLWRHRVPSRAKDRSGVAGATNTKNGYRYICIQNKYYLAHRLAWAFMTGEWPENDIDHVDRNRTNNAFSNLRLATRSQNLANSRKKSSDPDAIKGVSFHKARQQWRARITYNYREISLGWFKDQESASHAYTAKAKQLFGEFAAA